MDHLVFLERDIQRILPGVGDRPLLTSKDELESFGRETGRAFQIEGRYVQSHGGTRNPSELMVYKLLCRNG
jgi:hypothetical protein